MSDNSRSLFGQSDDQIGSSHTHTCNTTSALPFHLSSLHQTLSPTTVSPFSLLILNNGVHRPIARRISEYPASTSRTRYGAVICSGVLRSTIMIMTSKRMDLEFIAPPQKGRPATRGPQSPDQEIPMAARPESEPWSMRSASSSASPRSFHAQTRLPSVSHILQPPPSTLQIPIRPRPPQGQLPADFPLPPDRDQHYHQEQPQWPQPQSQSQLQAPAQERRDSSLEGHQSSSAYLSASSRASQKHKRRRATSLQLEALDEVFERTMFPTTEVRNGLARELEMSNRTVQIWFQNKRQAFRANERKHSMDSADLMSSSVTLSELDDSLEERALAPDSPSSVEHSGGRRGL